MTVFVTRGARGAERYAILRPNKDAYVGDLVDAVIAKLKLDVAADMVILRFPPSGDGVPGEVLDPCDRLAAASVRDESRLVVEVISTRTAGACMRCYYIYPRCFHLVFPLTSWAPRC